MFKLADKGSGVKKWEMSSIGRSRFNLSWLVTAQILLKLYHYPIYSSFSVVWRFLVKGLTEFGSVNLRAVSVGQSLSDWPNVHRGNAGSICWIDTRIGWSSVAHPFVAFFISPSCR